MASLLAGVAALSAGCGSVAPDLFTIQRTGSVPGARLNLVASDDGQLRCNGGPRRLMSAHELLEARQLQRDLEKDATAGLALSPGRQSILTYAVTTPSGHIQFSDTSPGVQPVLLRVAAFTREVAIGVCHLPR